MKSDNIHRLHKLVMALLLMASSSSPRSALAITRIVSNLNDAGAASLRNTIAASVAGDTVTFAEGLAGTIILTGGELTIARDLTILGPGSARLALQGSGGRVFRVISGTVRLSGLTLVKGFVFNQDGGAILNAGVLTLQDCVVSGNIAQPSSGGGSGGGIYNTGSLTASNCAFVGNSGGMPSGGQGSGGGIYNIGVMVLTGCTVSGNNTLGSGGGVYNGGTLTILGCTIAGNAAGRGPGGGIWNSAALTVRNSTVSGNIAQFEGPGLRTEGVATLQNTLISGNIGTNRPGPDVDLVHGVDVSGTITSHGHNLIGKTNASAGWLAIDLTGSVAAPLDPLLGPLQDNGGRTFTLLPSTASAAVDAGDDAVLGPPLNLTTDQRGFPRKLGPHIDIGAVELDSAQAGANFVVNTTDDHNDGVASAADCTLREAIMVANASADAITITFASSVTGVITLRLGELAINHDLAILGPGAMVLAISGNSSSRVFNISTGTVVISGLAITNGRVVGFRGNDGNPGGSPGGNGGSTLGGGIYSHTALTVSNCWIAGNVLLGGTGGAGGPAEGDRSSGTGGTGGLVAGGGICNLGSLTLANCTISGNTVTAGLGGSGANGNDYLVGDGGNGGAGGSATGAGVANAGTLRLNNCTLVGNVANGANGGAGGSAQEDGNGGAGGPGGSGAGGGLANLSNLSMASGTLSANAATSGTGGPGGYAGGRGVSGANGSQGLAQGGGLHSTTTFNLIQNSLIAFNSAPAGADCSGMFTSQGHNLVGIGFGSDGFTGTGDQVGTRRTINPLLGPLEFNGGSTPTLALLSGSPAIDKGNGGALGADQRGVPRPFDFTSLPNASGGDGSDIGAFELRLPVLKITRTSIKVVLSWPANDPGYTLETKTTLNSALPWSTVPGSPTIVGSQYTVSTNVPTTTSFYRLRK